MYENPQPNINSSYLDVLHSFINNWSTFFIYSSTTEKVKPCLQKQEKKADIICTEFIQIL